MKSTPAAYALWTHAVDRSGSTVPNPKNTFRSVMQPILRVRFYGWALFFISQQTRYQKRYVDANGQYRPLTTNTIASADSK